FWSILQETHQLILMFFFFSLLCLSFVGKAHQGQTEHMMVLLLGSLSRPVRFFARPDHERHRVNIQLKVLCDGEKRSLF
ncbi:MAG: hypothetical protein Q4A61_02630, partial [Porphyromonadaceae bacterium]|nr:hypothetical protein [Porphyromonadaceae bacterium]